MSITEKGKCYITHLNSNGLGVGSTSYGEVILPYVLPGELVEFERHVYRNVTNCVLKSIVEHSNDRQKPQCKHFGACGGCLLQHLYPENYLSFKKSAIENMLSEFNSNIHEITVIPASNRRRANLEAVKKQDRLLFGFHRFHSNHIIDIGDCPALSTKLNLLLLPLRELLEDILDYKQKAYIFLTEAYNGVDISLSIGDVARIDTIAREAIVKFGQNNENIIRFIFRHRKYSDVIIHKATPYVLFDDIAVEIDARCFLQASFKSDEILSKLVMDFAEANNSCQYIVDLFCGRGTFTLPLSRICAVDGFEGDKASLQALDQAISGLGRKINAIARDLFTNPLSVDELNKYQLAVINPPRAGAFEQSKNIANSTIQKLCYISCNPQTFLQDTKLLIAGGYKLAEIFPVDQFYWSPHLEVVGYFVR